MRTKYVLLAVMMLVAACRDLPTTPSVPDGYVRLRVYANVAATNVTSMTLEVRGEGAATPSFTTLQVKEGAVDGTLILPVATPFQVVGITDGPRETDVFRGETSLEFSQGEEPFAELTLFGASDSKPIKVKLGAVVLIVSPAADTLLPGETATFTARFLDANGAEVKGTVEWGSFDLARVSIDKNGMVLARDPGLVEIAAVGSGLAGSAWVQIYTRLELADVKAREAFHAWHRVLGYWGPTMFLSNASGEHGSPWANAGMSTLPDPPHAHRQQSR